MSEITDALTASPDTEKGFGAMIALDAAIILIVGIVDIINKNHLGGIESPWAGVIVIAMAAVLFVAAYCVFKEKSVGRYLAWVMAIVTLVYGVITTFNLVGDNMTFDIYFLLTGVFMMFYLIIPVMRPKTE